MNLTVKITSIYLKNFIGIYNGLGKKELEIDLSNLLDKEIILILGDNGHGKSTLGSVLHPLVGSTDKRSKIIRTGKEGIKVIKYIRNDGVEYDCKIVYTPTKTGHSSKGYITKISDEETTELNPNGNISSYKEILFEEIGISDAILKLSSQNDSMKGLVDMTATERKQNMVQFLPEDICSHYYKIIDKTYKEMRTRINIIVDNVGKMNNADTIEACLKVITDDINELVDKRDKCIGKIKEYETRISILEKGDDLEKLYKKTNKYVSELSGDLEDINIKISKISSSTSLDKSDISVSKISKIKEEIMSQIIEANTLIMVLSNNIDRLKRRRNEISDELATKESILEDISSDATLDELESIRKGYVKRYESLDKSLSKLNTNLNKDSLMMGYDIIRNIRQCIDNITDSSKSSIKDAISDIEKDIDSIDKLNELYSNREKSQEISNTITNKISALNSNSHLKDILDKRPNECKIDDCPFIANAKKWTMIEKELEKYHSLVEKSDNNINDLYSKINYQEEVVSVYKAIKSLFSYIKMNHHIINKLPFNDIYSSDDAIIKCIENKNRLSKADDFEPFIEVLECKEEYQELKYKKIPSIENEIRLLTTQGKLIENSKADVKRLKKELSDIIVQLNSDKENHDSIQSSINTKRDFMKSLDLLYNSKIEYDEKYEEVMECKETLKELEQHLKDLDEYRDKMKKRKIKLKEIEEELTPLSRKREIYKMEQLKLGEYQKELKSLEEDMYKVDIIRDSLSTKTGIPVDLLSMFLDEIRQMANVLLSKTFNGSLYLEEFEIDETDFAIPYKRNGDVGLDVSDASSSERSFISLALTLAIVEEIISGYGVMMLDEVDRGFSPANKYTFVNILGDQINKVNMSQTFLITHNYEYYTHYNVGYILFPAHGLKKYEDDDVVKVYK